jgi:16S rRNA (guanine1207-N2)-methyltransferase
MPQADAFAPLLDALDQCGADQISGEWLYLNAKSDLRIARELPAARLLCVTPNKAQHDRLKAQGLNVSAALDGKGALALIRLTRDRAETFGLIAEAAAALPENAPVFVLGDNDEGIRTVEKQVAEHWPLIALSTKRHARSFAFRNARNPVLDLWRAAAEAVPGSEAHSRPGLFAHDRLDLGSALLIEQLPDDLSGHAADFGCGWGALSVGLLNRNRKIAQLDVIDIDKRAVDAALANTAALGHPAAVEGRWADIAAADVPVRLYDVIIMNPPFHASNTPDPALGAAFFTAASKALKPGGLLFAVANRKLPYEPVLKSGFRNSKQLFEGEGYKIIRAMR